MALTVPYDAAGLDGKLRMVIDQIIAAIQTWAGKVDGINAAERLNELSTGLASLPTVPTGAVFSWLTATPPTGYLICDGSAISRTTYANLFAILGTTAGAGDGSTTFNIPDYRGRFLFGKAASGTGSTLLGTFGSIDHTHTGPSHTHTISGATANESTHTHGAGTYATPAHSHGDSTDGDGAQTEEVQAGTGSTILNHPGHAHTIDSQAAMAISGTSGAGSAHSHSAGTLATAADGTGNTGTANPPGLAANVIIKT